MVFLDLGVSISVCVNSTCGPFPRVLPKFLESAITIRRRKYQMRSTFPAQAMVLPNSDQGGKYAASGAPHHL